MRIIAGTAGRIRLDAPKSLARPSTDRLREALFSILGPGLGGARVLDLFAGSGALGIEALSRGAKSAVFVESDRHAVKTIRANLDRAGLSELATIIARDAFRSLSSLNQSFDYIFADPPYQHHESERNYLHELLHDPHLVTRLDPTGKLIVETGSGHLPEALGRWQHTQSRRYGKSHLHFFTQAC